MATAKGIIGKSRAAEQETKSTEIEITADIAKKLLEFNGENRPYSKSLAKNYANQILRDVWHFNGENLIITVDADGVEHLTNGQHTLNAVILAQESLDAADGENADQIYIKKVITYGAPHDHADTVDQNKKRTNSDILFRSGIEVPEDWNKSQAKRSKFCKTLSTAANVVWQRFGGKKVGDALKFDPAEQERILTENPALIDFVTTVLNEDSDDCGNGGLKISLAYAAALGYVSCLDAEGELVAESADDFKSFISKVAQGTGFSKGDPSHAITGFWNKLPPGSKNRDIDWVGPFVKVLNALHAGQKTTPAKVKLTKNEWEDRPLLVGYDEACYIAANTPEEVEQETEEIDVLDPEDIPEIDE